MQRWDWKRQSLMDLGPEEPGASPPTPQGADSLSPRQTLGSGFWGFPSRTTLGMVEGMGWET